MIAILLIAIAAGCASALMFASIISGALISLVLFYLAPLPLMVTALVTIAPAAAAMVTMTTLTLNLWLAAKITATSGCLNRPWPDLKNVALPSMTLSALCVAIAFSFSGGMLAILALVVAVALMMAY